MTQFFGDGQQRDEPVPPPGPPAPGRPLLNENETHINNQLFGNLEDPRLLETLHQFPGQPVQHHFGTMNPYGHPDLSHANMMDLFQQNQAFHQAPLSAPAHSLSFPQHLHAQAFAPVHQQPAVRMSSHQRTQSGTFAKPLHTAQPVQPAPIAPRQPPDPQPQTADIFRRSGSEYVPTIVGSELYSHAAKEMLRMGRDARPDSYMERRMTFTYGSDTGFKGASYNPPKNVSVQAQRLEADKAELVHKSYKAPLSRSESASGAQEAAPPAQSTSLESVADESDDEQDSSRKRRRDDDSDNETSVAKPSKRRPRPQLSASIAPQTPVTEDGTPTTPGGGSRKASDKNARVNLTEDEKKMNHIRSEQKRRNQIREGFADLTALMPHSSSAGPSKCTILQKAVDWMRELIEGNDKLRAQLNSMPSSASQTPLTAQ